MMAVKVHNECRVVVGTIIWAVAGGAIVYGSIAHRRRVECIDSPAVRGGECKMKSFPNPDGAGAQF